MQLGDLPESALVKGSANCVVESYCLLIDESGKAVIWKLRFRNGRVETYFLAPAVAVHFAKCAADAAGRYGWPASENWPENQPEITGQDMDFLNCRFPMAVGMRVLAYQDALVAALLLGKDLVQAIRLTPEHATQIGGMHREAIQSGILRDIAAENPPTGSKN